MIVATRDEVIKRDYQFYKIWQVLDDSEFVPVLQKYATDNDVDLRIYGELHGMGILNRVWYGEDQYIKFFDCSIDGTWLSPQEFVVLLIDLDLFRYHVPIVSVVDTLEEALNVPCNFISDGHKLKPNGKPNYTEGVVIKPLYNVTQRNDSIFRIKHKSALFGEKTGRTVVKVYDNQIVELHDIFLQYINENRVISAISKMGVDKKMGEYIVAVIEDAKQDFIDDNPDVDFDNMEKKDKKFIFNVGKYIVPILREYL